MARIKYYTAAAKAEGAGKQVLQEAVLQKHAPKNLNGKVSEIQIILAAVFSKSGELEHSLSVELGEWFQNKLVPMINDKGTDSLISVCMDGIGKDGLGERLNSTEYSCVIGAGDEIALFKNGTSVAIYSIEELFGKAVLIPMEPGNIGIMVQPECGGGLVISDGVIESDDFYAKQLAGCVSKVFDEKQLERCVSEITAIEDIQAGSVIAIKFAEN